MSALSDVLKIYRRQAGASSQLGKQAAEDLAALGTCRQICRRLVDWVDRTNGSERVELLQMYEIAKAVVKLTSEAEQPELVPSQTG